MHIYGEMCMCFLASYISAYLENGFKTLALAEPNIPGAHGVQDANGSEPLQVQFSSRRWSVFFRKTAGSRHSVCFVERGLLGAVLGGTRGNKPPGVPSHTIRYKKKARSHVGGQL